MGLTRRRIESSPKCPTAPQRGDVPGSGAVARETAPATTVTVILCAGGCLIPRSLSNGHCTS